jgi:hypothetical protein
VLQCNIREEIGSKISSSHSAVAEDTNFLGLLHPEEGATSLLMSVSIFLPTVRLNIHIKTRLNSGNFAMI